MWDNEKLVEVLKENGVVVMPTDTLYGLAGRAEDKNVVNRIYSIRKRIGSKPCIILISDYSELSLFSITLTEAQSEYLKNRIEGPTSVVLDCPHEDFIYLHRGVDSLAFRRPANPLLQELLQKTGPLVAPSANIEGEKPAENIEEAKNYFGDSVDLYVDGGEITGKASRIIQLHPDGSTTILRE